MSIQQLGNLSLAENDGTAPSSDLRPVQEPAESEPHSVESSSLTDAIHESDESDPDEDSEDDPDDPNSYRLHHEVLTDILADLKAEISAPSSTTTTAAEESFAAHQARWRSILVDSLAAKYSNRQIISPPIDHIRMNFLPAADEAWCPCCITEELEGFTLTADGGVTTVEFLKGLAGWLYPEGVELEKYEVLKETFKGGLVVTGVDYMRVGDDQLYSKKVWIYCDGEKRDENRRTPKRGCDDFHEDEAKEQQEEIQE